MIVVDASVLAPALADDGPDGDVARARLHGQRLTAPELIDAEVLWVVRRHSAAGLLTAQRGELALDDLVNLPLRRVPHRRLLRRAWELRSTITAYDALYVALAEALDVTLLTADAPLTRAPGPACRIELLT